MDAVDEELLEEAALMADIDDYDNAVMADKLGFDYISTTLRGFTRETKGLRVTCTLRL